MKKEITVMEVIRLLLSKWWLLAVSAIIFGGIALTYSNTVLMPVYMSKGMIYVNSDYLEDIASLKQEEGRDVNLNNIMTSIRLATTYTEVIKSETFLTKVVEMTKLDYSVENIRKMLTVTSKNETEILQISITNTDPQAATLLVDAILEISKSEIKRVIKGGSVEIIDNAKLPTLPVGPNKPRNTMLGFIFGLFVASVIVILRDVLDNRVRNQEDLTKRYQLPILGLIPSIRSSHRNYYYSRPAILPGENILK